MSAPSNGELAVTANPERGMANTADPTGAINDQQMNADSEMDTSPLGVGETLVDYNEEEDAADRGGDMQVEVTQIGAEMAPGLDAATAAAVANGKALVTDWRQGQQAPVAQAQTSAGASEVKTPQSESAKSTILELLDEKFRFTGPDGHQTMLEAGMMGAARSISEVLLERNTTYDLGRSDPLTGNVAAFPNEEEKALRGLGKFADDPVWDKTLAALSEELRDGSVTDLRKQTPLVNKAIDIAGRPLLAKRLRAFNQKVGECRNIWNYQNKHATTPVDGEQCLNPNNEPARRLVVDITGLSLDQVKAGYVPCVLAGAKQKEVYLQVTPNIAGHQYANTVCMPVDLFMEMEGKSSLFDNLAASALVQEAEVSHVDAGHASMVSVGGADVRLESRQAYQALLLAGLNTFMGSVTELDPQHDLYLL